MTTSSHFDDQLIGLIEAYRTCEFLTISRSGTPIAWPVAGAVHPDRASFVVSTSIGLARKALNVRRDPPVALLFSDPTGSTLEHPPQVLIHGSATCTDSVESGFVSHAFLWRRLLTIQPQTGKRPFGPLARHVMKPYFMRLFITITPERIELCPAADVEPANAVCAAEEPPVSGVLRQVAEELRTYRSAVLAAFDPSGQPTLARITARPVDGALLLEGLDDKALLPGRASLLAHTHDLGLDGLRSFATSGTLTRTGGQWYLHPENFIPGVRPGVLASIRFLFDLRRNAARYMARRRLPYPAIVWSELAAISDAIPSTAPIDGAADDLR